jgi:hypothetical protein
LQATGTSQPALETSHAPVIALVIIAEQVQEAMEGKNAEFSLKRVSGGPCLSPGNA